MRYFYIAAFFILFSCTKALDVESPSFALSRDRVMNDEKSLNAYVNYLYSRFYDIFDFSTSYFSLGYVLSLMCDDLHRVHQSTNLTVNAIYNNDHFAISNLSSTPNYVIPDFFDKFQSLVVMCNDVIAFYESKGEVNNTYMEVKSLRAIIYFYLAQLYGDVPVLITNDFDYNFMEQKRPYNDVLLFCISELEDVENNIVENSLKFNYSSTGNVYTERINSNVVSYFLSYCYLMNGDFGNSKKYIYKLLNKVNLEKDLSKKMLFTSSEVIWSFRGVIGSFGSSPNIYLSRYLNYRNISSTSQNVFNSLDRIFRVSDSLINLYDVNDKRLVNYFLKTNFQGQDIYLPYKYKSTGIVSSLDDLNKEAYVFARLSTVYFNLIEILVKENDMVNAAKYYNEFNRINFDNYVDVDTLSLDFVLNERRKELFVEMGDRWFSMKRNNVIDEIMSINTPLKSNGLVLWSPEKKFLPLPLMSLLLNPNLNK